MYSISSYIDINNKFLEIEKIILEVDILGYSFEEFLKDENETTTNFSISLGDLDELKDFHYYLLEYEKSTTTEYIYSTGEEIVYDVLSCHISRVDVSNFGEKNEKYNDLDIIGKRCWENNLADQYFLMEEEEEFYLMYEDILRMKKILDYEKLKKELPINTNQKEKQPNKI